MKDLDISEDLIPLSYFKSHASEVIDGLTTGSPQKVITKNGRARAVVMSATEYEEIREREAFMTAVIEGLKDVEEGRTISHSKLKRELAKKFGRLK